MISFAEEKMMSFHVRHALGIMAAALLAAAALFAQAQPFPSRPITMVVPYPPGASTDMVARLVAPKLSAALGQPVVVESRAGAGGSVGAAYVAKSPPDGYRILMATQPIVAINPYFQKDMGFHPLKDLTALTKAVNAPVGIAVSASLPIHSMAQFIQYAKDNPGALTYGTAGTRAHRYDARAVQGRRTDAHRPAGRPHQGRHRDHVGIQAAHGRAEDPRDRDRRAEPFLRHPGYPDDCRDASGP
jgi:tripartite-type tricarboxylate transporter receptor subunit TctC